MSQEEQTILGIETSCDETAAAVIKGNSEHMEVLSDVVSSQVDIHKKYGGVIPEVAAREHVLNIIPVVHEALDQAGMTGKNMDKIAVTIGPGLITSLNTGVETAKSLSFAWEVPAVGVDHIEGHIYANYLTHGFNNIQLPAMVLTVSGGHTMLILIKAPGQYETIGITRDDAAGEAFDKAAKLMELGYPGGPVVSQQAEEYLQNNKEVKEVMSFPRPMIDSGNYDFSFSGLKTSLLYKIKKDPDWKSKIPQYCYEFQQAIIDVLVQKTIKAAGSYGVKSVMLSGGVAANQKFRSDLVRGVENKLPETGVFIPNMKYTTDNAAMIAAPAMFKKGGNWEDLTVRCQLKF